MDEINQTSYHSPLGKARWYHYFMGVAKLTANLSYAKRLQVGCIAVRDRRIVATGINGTPQGCDNTCEYEVPATPEMLAQNPFANLVTKDNVLHAEANLIRFAEEHQIDLTDCTLFITHACCGPCADKVVAAGFKEVVFDIPYRLTDGVDILAKNQVPCYELRQLSEHDLEDGSATPVPG